MYAIAPHKSTNSCEFWFGKSIAHKNYAWIFPHGNGAHVGNGSIDEKGVKETFSNFLDKADIKETTKQKGYYIPVWKNPPLYRDGVFFVGDAAEQVLPFTYEGIYYAMKSSEVLSEAIIQENPALYEKVWKKKYYRRFSGMRVLQTVFLYNDYLSEKLVALHENEAFREKSMQYWTGERSSGNKLYTYLKIVKHILFEK